jgi:Family of unknown function (DUF5317)
MLVIAVALLLAASARLAGGRFSALAAVRLRAPWLPAVALALQVLIIDVIDRGPRPLLITLHLLTYALAAAFVWLNRSIPGLVVVAVGAASNGGTIALNGGVLPASARALHAAGIVKDPRDFVNNGVLPHPVLGFLGDMFAWPKPMPLANVFSVGDVLIVVGIGIAVHRLTGSRLLARRPTVAAAAPNPREGAELVSGRALDEWKRT